MKQKYQLEWSGNQATIWCDNQQIGTVEYARISEVFVVKLDKLCHTDRWNAQCEDRESVDEFISYNINQ